MMTGHALLIHTPNHLREELVYETCWKVKIGVRMWYFEAWIDTLRFTSKYLHKLGASIRDIARLLECSPGMVWHVLRDMNDLSKELTDLQNWVQSQDHPEYQKRYDAIISRLTKPEEEEHEDS